MTQLHFESFHHLIEEYTRELPTIMRQHPLTQKLVPRVTDGLVLNELPFTVAVIGQMRVGKSSLLNTLVGADLAVTGVNETTATINWFKYAPEEKCDRFRVVWRNRPEEELPRSEIEHWICNSEFVRDTLRLEFFADAEFLKNAYIVDTPGTRAVIDSHEETIQNFIASPQDTERADNESRTQGDRADAIIYVLMPVARQTDEELLQSFEQGSRIPNAAPYNSLAVVHKWETLNADDPYEEVLRKVERIKQSFKNHVAEVLPVSAPMGWACEHFDDDFWEIVFQLGCLPNDFRRKMLLTDKRFFAESPDCPVSVSKRERLKSEYKLPWPTLKFLVNRTSIAKATTPTELKEAIRKIAGIDTLRSTLDKRFFSRSKMIRQFGVLAKTLPACNEAAVSLRNHKILYTRILNDAEAAIKSMSAGACSDPVRNYIAETREIVHSDLATASDTLKRLDRLVQPVTDAFDDMNKDTKFLDRLDVLDKYPWGSEWKTNLAYLLGQGGPQWNERISLMVPDQATLSPDEMIVRLENELSSLVKLQIEATGEAHSLIEHARNRLESILNELEANATE